MGLKQNIKQVIRGLGYEISRFSVATNTVARKREMLHQYGIDLVLDIGANIGQFATMMRKDFAYRGRIVSFEPLTSAFSVLKSNSQHDADWQVMNFAIGDRDGTQEINIAGNSFSSSILPMLPLHLASAPEARYVGVETITIKRLDTIFDEVRKAARKVFMKIDTQGFEKQVLLGASKSLPSIDTVQMEMSMAPLYAGELLFVDMCQMMSEQGYTLMRIENGLSDPTSGRLLQVDGIFHRL